MPGTKAGSIKRRATMIARLGSEEAYIAHQVKLGRVGGTMSNTGGFASSRELAVRAGRMGGLKSRKSKPRARKARVEPYDIEEDRFLTELSGLTINKKSLITRLFKK